MRQAALYYEWNALEVAEAQRADARAESSALVGSPLLGRGVLSLAYTLQARIRQAHGEHEAASALFTQAVTVAREPRHPRYLAQAQAAQVRFWLAHGQAEAVTRWREAWVRTKEAATIYEDEPCAVTVAGVLLAQGEPEQALRLLDGFHDHARAQGRLGSELEILMLCALAEDAQGQTRQAVQHLEQAIMLAEPQGYIRLFVDEGVPMLTLLLQVLSSWEGRHGADYVLRLLSILQPEHPQHAEQLPALQVPLRQRDLDAHPHNPPVQPTRSIGREQEIAQVCRQLRRPEVRLLTLTGPGGVGKTHLALAAAHDLVPDCTDGVSFVNLAAISEPDFMLPAIAQRLQLREADTRSPLEVLQAALADHSLLLLLDNFEQVLAAAPPLADLLSACPWLKLLVTSRAALRLSGEHELAVLPLALPDLAQLPAPEALLQYAHCALFVQPVQSIQPDFAVTPANTPAIAEICIRLDGLPLAIELAAARSRLLSPQALLARLSHRLDVLAGGTPNPPAPHPPMRATIAPPSHLLPPHIQR